MLLPSWLLWVCLACCVICELLIEDLAWLARASMSHWMLDPGALSMVLVHDDWLDSDALSRHDGSVDGARI